MCQDFDLDAKIDIASQRLRFSCGQNRALFLIMPLAFQENCIQMPRKTTVTIQKPGEAFG